MLFSISWKQQIWTPNFSDGKWHYEQIHITISWTRLPLVGQTSSPTPNSHYFPKKKVLPINKWDDQCKEFRVEPGSHGLQTLQSCDLWSCERKQPMPLEISIIQKPQLPNSFTKACVSCCERFLPELSPAPTSSGPWRKEVDLCRVPLGWCLKIADESSSREQPKR